jgi:adhesin HecA-like repeat protein
MIDEIFSSLRGVVSIGVVQSANDAGEAQTVTLVTADGVVRADVEVMQIFGFASLPPSNGAICLVVAVGGDPANLRALPIACPAARFGGMVGGDAAMYAADGSRVHIKPDGVVEIWAGSTLTINAPNVTLTGTLTAQGDVIAGSGKISLVNHTHPDPQGGETGAPTG